MPHVPARHRTPVGLLAAAVATTGAVAGLALGASTPDAQAQTSPTTPDTVVVRLQGQMTLKFDAAFLKTMKRSGASVRVKSGAKWTAKKRLVTLPVDATAAVRFTPPDADILATGSIAFRRKDKRNVTTQDITLRLREAGADLGGTVRGRPGRQFAALTASTDTNITQTAAGAKFVNLPMLVSPDLARATRQAKIKGIKEGAILGVLNVEVAANLPNFQLPTVKIPEITIPEGALPTLPSLPTLPPLPELPSIPGLPEIDPTLIPSIPGITAP